MKWLPWLLRRQAESDIVMFVFECVYMSVCVCVVMDIWLFNNSHLCQFNEIVHKIINWYMKNAK